jgi:hypothetical protein
MTFDPVAVAGEVAKYDELIQGFFPEISAIAGLATGGASTPITGLVGLVLKAVDDAAKTVAASKPGASAQDILTELLNHNTPGKANSPILS